MAPGVRESGLLARVERARKLASTYVSAWTPHLEATRQTLRDAMKTSENKSRLVIHTTGWGLSDLPLEDLASQQNEVDLVAPVWWRESYKKAKGHQALQFTISDATGYLEDYSAAPSTAMPGKADLRAPVDGRVMSVNYLHEILATTGPVRHPSEEDIDRARALTGAHVAALEASEGQALLITPFARYETKRGKSERLEIIPPHILAKDPFTTWDWHMAPLGAIDQGLDIHLKVGAWWL